MFDAYVMDRNDGSNLLLVKTSIHCYMSAISNAGLFLVVKFNC